MPTLLQIRKLCLHGAGIGDRPHLVSDINLDIDSGDVFALVGESGSGKTLIAKSILGLLPPSCAIHSGEILFEGTNLQALSARAMRHVRGRAIGMIFQEPLTSLNPALTIGCQVKEAMAFHQHRDSEEIHELAVAMLEKVSIDDPERALEKYPHQFSGGMRQRIMLASVMLLRPRLLIADEPTTALDVIIQRDVLALMLELAQEANTAVLLITHDLGLVAHYANKVSVLQNGEIVEAGAVEQVLSKPRHVYTRRLLNASPAGRLEAAAPDRHGAELPAPKPLFEINSLTVAFDLPRSWPWSKAIRYRAVNDLDLAIAEGETLAVIGESGSGKTTLGRTLVNLQEATAGSVLFDGRDIRHLDAAARQRYRRDVQIVFQDPYSSLDPRMRVAAIVGEGLRHVKGLSREEKSENIRNVLSEVGLDPMLGRRFPHQLSGGQRQRVSIARAIVMRPRVIIADEPLSALDMTVQHKILGLLASLKHRYDFTLMIISHDLAVAEYLSDRIAVMCAGELIEHAPTRTFFRAPLHPYSCRLLESMLRLTSKGTDSYAADRRAVAVPPSPPPGYVYHTPVRNCGVAGRMTALAANHFVALQPRT